MNGAMKKPDTNGNFNLIQNTVPITQSDPAA